MNRIPAVLIAALLFPACGGNMATEDPLAPIPTRVDVGSIEPPPLRVEWRRAPEIPAGETEPVLATQAAAVGATLAYLPRGTEMIALSLDDGTEVWRLQLGIEIVAQPLADAAGVSVPTRDGWLLLDEMARLRSSLPVEHPARAGMATVDGVVQVDAAGVERLRLLPVESVASVWRTALEGAAVLTIAADEAAVIVIDEAGTASALRLQDGALLWRSDEKLKPVRPAVYRDQVIVIGEDHRVRALRVRDGKRSWTGKDIGVRVGAAPVVVDDVIWVPGLDAAIHGYDWGGSHLFRVPMSGRVYIDLVSWGRWVIASPQYGPWTMVRAPLWRVGPGDPGQPRSVTITSDGELSLRPGVGAVGVLVSDDVGSVRLLAPPPG